MKRKYLAQQQYNHTKTRKNMNRIANTLLLVSALMIAQVCQANIKLPHIISSHMVLQQKSQCPLWGWANPGEEVKVQCSWGVNVQAVTGVNGRWEVTVTTPSYGGPYTITFNGDNSITLNDIMIGDVYVASGEVNMQIALHGMGSNTIIGGEEAIKEAQESNNHNIRVIGIPQNVSFKEEDDVAAYWVDITHPTVGYMSAMAYFFAAKVYKETGVPIGIINPAWGGSSCESWMSEEFLQQLPEYKTEIEQYHNGIPQQETLIKWIKAHDKADMSRGFEGMEFTDTECARVGYDDSDWPSMMIPSYYDNPYLLGAYDGALWFRKWVEIPDDWQDKQLILSLGTIDDMDETFVNGELVGRNMGPGSFSVNRVYKIHPGLVRKGRMLIAVRMIDDGNSGGICGRPDMLKVYPEGEENNNISIAGEWTYQPVAELCDHEYYLYNYRNKEYNQRPKIDVTLTNKTLFAAFKAMIKPLTPFTIKGVLWSQGESNIGLGKAERYYKLLPLLAECWRSEFKSPNLKFYYTQQFPYPYDQEAPTYEFREAQRRCMKEIPNSGMACMLDLGNKESLTTRTKKEEGERLALLALKDIYGQNIESMGPELETFTVNKSSNSIELTFSHTTGGLMLKGDAIKDFEISDNNGVFYPANAVEEGNKLIVSSPDVNKPRNVRYAWKNWVESPSLYNGAGLPASSFTTEKSFSVNSENMMKANKN